MNHKNEPSLPLASLQKHDRAELVKIAATDGKLVSHLAALGIMPDVQIVIEEIAPFRGPIMVRVGHACYAIGRNIARLMYVKKL